MCEVRVFRREEEKETLLLRDVYLIEQEGETLRFVTIFGEEQVANAEIEEVSFSDNKVVIRERRAF
jgi:predicted RNA-binding protein